MDVNKLDLRIYYMDYGILKKVGSPYHKCKSYTDIDESIKMIRSSRVWYNKYQLVILKYDHDNYRTDIIQVIEPIKN